MLVGTYTANKAIVDADMANVRHYEALVSFEKVYAPFDGVITARNTDIGDLINSGSSTAPKTDLFHIAQAGTLRVYVNVPEEYSRGVKPERTIADIVLAEFPGQKFPGKVVRTSEAINGTTRTLLTEIDLTNPANTLLTGSYAEVHLRIPSAHTTFLIPVETLIFRSEHLQVGVVRKGRVVLTDVTPGHDLGTEIEAVAGLKADDRVVVNPPDSLVSGQAVNVVQACAAGRCTMKFSATMLLDYNTGRAGRFLLLATAVASARRVRGRPEVQNAFDAHAPCLQGNGQLEDGAAQRSEPRRKLVGDLSRFSTERSGTTDQCLQPEP